MLELLLIVVNITGGILLGLSTLDKWDGESDFFNKIAGVLAPFQTIIGGALVVIPLLRLFGGHFSLYAIVSILGGVLLLIHVFGKSLVFEDSLRKLSEMLMPFKTIIGIVLLVMGILAVF